MDSNTDSVIDGSKDKKVKHNKVGPEPNALGNDSNTLYVANSGSNSDSVIDETSDKNVKDITVIPSSVGIV
jgi:YVTN family beta-propeller protein